MNYNIQHKDHCVDIRNGGIRISLFATFATIVVFALYGYIASPLNIGIISTNISHLMSNLGLAVFLFLIGSLFAIGYGVYRICLAEKMRVQSSTDAKKKRDDIDGMFLP